MNRLEWRNPCFKKGEPAMKSKWSARAAAIALGLFLATWFPASAAADSCNTLRGQGANALKPSSVTVTAYQGGPSALLAWSLASNAPSDAFSGWCVEKKHVASSKKREECYSHIGIRFARFNSCVAAGYCPSGAFKFRVKLENNCGLDEPWSDAVGFEFSG